MLGMAQTQVPATRRTTPKTTKSRQTQTYDMDAELLEEFGEAEIKTVECGGR